jgi:hypothetical protein
LVALVGRWCLTGPYWDKKVVSVFVHFSLRHETINTAELAELEPKLFDKLFGAGTVASLEELKAKIKEDAETQFAANRPKIIR